MVPKIIPSHGLIAAFQAALCPCSESPMPALSTGVWPEDGRRERGYPPHSEALQDGTEVQGKGRRRKRERRPPQNSEALQHGTEREKEREERERTPPPREAPSAKKLAHHGAMLVRNLNLSYKYSLKLASINSSKKHQFFTIKSPV